MEKIYKWIALDYDGYLKAFFDKPERVPSRNKDEISWFDKERKYDYCVLTDNESEAISLVGYENAERLKKQPAKLSFKLDFEYRKG